MNDSLKQLHINTAAHFYGAFVVIRILGEIFHFSHALYLNVHTAGGLLVFWSIYYFLIRNNASSDQGVRVMSIITFIQMVYAFVIPSVIYDSVKSVCKKYPPFTELKTIGLITCVTLVLLLIMYQVHKYIFTKYRS